ncbi:putative F-box protein At3g21120 isoform X2 [Rosa chinensis]|nr:putative F-box protein At3g21120 isoform X2 [Rosa chinensis]
MRFKCACKSWYNLIKSPSFVAKNLSYSKNNEFASSTSLVFKRTVLKDNTIKDKNEITSILSEDNNNRKETLLSLLTLSNHDDQNFGCIVEDFPLPSPMCFYALNIPLAGHCDGIVCLSLVNDEDVVLYNPSIKEDFEFLPKSCLLLPHKDFNDFDNEDDYYDALRSDPRGVGFGFDSKAKVYKVVRIVGFTSGYYADTHPSRAEVFTLGARSWREIKIDTKVTVFSHPSFNICLKGICYWSALIRDKEVLLSFHMSEELFDEISVPESIHHMEGFLKTFSVWKESIVLVAYKRDDDPKFLDIWVMGEPGDFRGSWTKHLTIGPVECDIPLSFWKSDEILVGTADGCVVSYNIDTQTLKYLPIHVAEGPSRTQCLVYVNSIISVKENNSSMRQLP